MLRFDVNKNAVRLNFGTRAEHATGHWLRLRYAILVQAKRPSIKYTPEDMHYTARATERELCIRFQCALCSRSFASSSPFSDVICVGNICPFLLFASIVGLRLPRRRDFV